MKTVWYPTIEDILKRGLRRRLIPDGIKARALRRFYNTMAALMIHQLQELCIDGLKQFTEFICDAGQSNPPFRLTILLKDKNTLAFYPPFLNIKRDILEVVDELLAAIVNWPRIENSLPMEMQIPKTAASKVLKVISFVH